MCLCREGLKRKFEVSSFRWLLYIIDHLLLIRAYALESPGKHLENSARSVWGSRSGVGGAGHCVSALTELPLILRRGWWRSSLLQALAVFPLRKPLRLLEGTVGKDVGVWKWNAFFLSSSPESAWYCCRSKSAPSRIPLPPQWVKPSSVRDRLLSGWCVSLLRLSGTWGQAAEITAWNPFELLPANGLKAFHTPHLALLVIPCFFFIVNLW